DIFNNTILYSPVQNFLQCILLRKIEGIESALTWIQQNAQVSLARANADILTLDAGGMDDLMSPITRLGAQVGSDGTGPSTSTGTMPTVARIVSGQLESLRRQRDLFLLMLAAWIVLALAGFVWMVARMRARERVPPNVYHQPTEKGMPIGEEDGYEMSEIECEDSSTNLTRLPTSRVGTWRERFQHRRTQSLGRYR
ncbi:plasma membrane fusion protein prm1, partial [Tilletia horrida]